MCMQDAAEYKAAAAHVELAKKMHKRDSATAPQVGERVAFVIIKGAKNAKAHEKAEDPIYALEHNLPIDAQHYLDHHLSQPLLRIFEPIIGEKRAKSLLSGAVVPRALRAACMWRMHRTAHHAAARMRGACMPLMLPHACCRAPPCARCLHAADATVLRPWLSACMLPHSACCSPHAYCRAAPEDRRTGTALSVCACIRRFTLQCFA
jgi:hypothetical protein